jgi:hypothetical protein
MVTPIMENVPVEVASNCITRGWKALVAGEAIHPEDVTALKERGFNPEDFVKPPDDEDIDVDIQTNDGGGDPNGAP